ncbi:hypothetical protein UY3_13619 [Chelonia mydas]|uniref:Uncharacterized protein n=1 Tax=Chelonia mydas TaxID=8469 RepID=M7AUZ7_CHEMY|nr:hypothetical protein UY3_13619 [Chelonia mydas]
MGAVGSSGQHIPQPMPLSAAPIGLKRRTVASGSCDRLNLRTPQKRPSCFRTMFFRTCGNAEKKHGHFHHPQEKYGIHFSSLGAWSSVKKVLISNSSKEEEGVAKGSPLASH